MRTELAKRLGIEFPIFGFSHCRDVVAAVTNAGGFGVLGASGFRSPEELEIELDWIDKHVQGRPYGVDVIIPNKYFGQDETDHEKLLSLVQSAIPDGHRQFVEKLLDDYGVPRLPPDEVSKDRLRMTESTNAPLVDAALRHPNVKLIANALGTPPPHITDKIKAAGVMVGALCGAGKHARAHIAAGMDFIVAQGTEGGGHCGEIGSSILWPEVVDIAGDVPVIAAGGVGSGRQMFAALGMGAQGVWCGSIWLTTRESSSNPVAKERLLAASSSDTVRSKYPTGKYSRLLRSKFSEAWGTDGNPEPLGPPMQSMLLTEANARMERYPEKSRDLLWVPVGQVVGRMNEELSARDVVLQMVNEYVETLERMNALMPAIQ